MARGTQDGGLQSYDKAINISDLGEVAERLLMGGGSISRTGRISWATGFEGIVPNSIPTDMSFGGTGTNNEVIVAQGGSANPIIGINPINFYPAWQGNNFLALVTGGATTNTASAFKYFPYPSQTGKWGLEFMLMPGSFLSHIDIILKRSIAPGGATQQALLRLSMGASLASTFLQYQDASLAFPLLKDFSNTMDISGGVYYNWKIIVDFANNRWQSVTVDGYKFDFINDPTLSANNALVTSPAGPSDKSSFQFVLTADQNDNCSAQFDNIILTSDEL